MAISCQSIPLPAACVISKESSGSSTPPLCWRGLSPSNSKTAAGRCLVESRGFDFIGAIKRAHEHLVDLRMAHGIAGGIGHEILLRYIGDIFGIGVFGKEMIERLVLARPDFHRDRLPPFLGIREDRVHVVDDPPERIFPVLDDLAYGEFRDTGFHVRQPPQQSPEPAATGLRGWREDGPFGIRWLIAASIDVNLREASNPKRYGPGRCDKSCLRLGLCMDITCQFSRWHFAC